MDYEDPDDLDFIPAPSMQGGGYEEATISVTEKYLDVKLEEIPLADRIDLYEALKGALPPHKLQDLDLAQELVLQFMRVKELQSITLADRLTKANQKAQVANAVAGILGQLTRMQTELHTAERFKSIEGLMIRYFKKLPVDVVTKFLEDYEQLG